MQVEKEEQRSGRNKPTQIVKSYIDSGVYRRKFDEITNNPELNRVLYKLSKKMLFHRSGTEFEDMYWIEPNSIRIVAKEIDCSEKQTIIYSEATKRIVEEFEGLVTIHSHPEGTPPSINDFNSNFLNNYSLGIVVGHGGQIHIYSSEEYISPDYFDIKVAEYFLQGYNQAKAREKAIEYCMQTREIFYKEVQ